VDEFLVNPAGIVHPRPAQGPDTTVQPELSDAELVTMEPPT
jgi:dTMP kinase